MSLTLGNQAPFGRPTGGHTNFAIPDSPAHLLYLHDLPQRIRGALDGALIVDTIGAKMLHETRMLPKWYLPREDVMATLEPSQTTTHCPFKGDARYWNVRVGARVIADAFWEYPEPIAEAPPIAGLLAPDMDKLTTWWEEDEPLFGHPRDPFHRVDLRRSNRTVTVTVDGHTALRTATPLAVQETGMPTRWYVPLAEAAPGLLAPSTTTTVCPYKGMAAYWTVAGIADAAWGYPQPLAGAELLANFICFTEGDRIKVDVSRS